jgi:hypothetical protein
MRIDLRAGDLEVLPGAATLEATKALADEILAARPEVDRVIVYQPDPRGTTSGRSETWLRERGGAWICASGPR